MNLTQEELEICHILSGVFNYCTEYDEVLEDTRQSKTLYEEVARRTQILHYPNWQEIL